MSDLTAAASGLLHMIYPYGDQQQYLTGTLAYIEHARTAGATVLIAAPQDHREVLTPHLNGDNTVVFMDTTALGRHPARLIPAWQDWISRQTDGRVVHGINDAASPVFGTAYEAEARYAEWLLNLAFAKAPAWSLLCPVDTTLQSASDIEALIRCHPLMWNGTAQGPVADYQTGPYAHDALPEPPASAEYMAFDLDALPALRDKIAAYAQHHGLPLPRVRALTLAVSEVATNSIRYGGGSGTLRLWTQDDAIVCELRDEGVITDPLVGHQRPEPSRLGGRGLWFVNQICDLVQLRSSPGQGTRIRLWFDLLSAPEVPPPPQPSPHS